MLCTLASRKVGKDHLELPELLRYALVQTLATVTVDTGATQ